MKLSSPTCRRLRAAGLHLGICAVIAAVAAVITLSLWYPGVHASLSGGRQLFWLVVSVDVTMGPLLTLVVFNTAKPRRVLVRDLSVIAVLQLAALSYGLYTAYLARPVALVFEVDRFRVIAANTVRLEELPAAAAKYRSLPLSGPWMLGARSLQTSDERTEALSLAAKGFDIGQRPSFWQPYDQSRSDALAQSRPVEQLLQRYTARRGELEAILAEARLSPSEARFLPVDAREDWVVILDAAGNIAAYAPFDGFFSSPEASVSRAQ